MPNEKKTPCITRYLYDKDKPTNLDFGLLLKTEYDMQLFSLNNVNIEDNPMFIHFTPTSVTPKCYFYIESRDQ